ncbi:hypothetical protein ACEQ8H_004788 [Pleosporales sp. CAS-2024a]
MTTPTFQPNGVPVQNPIPSSSFLQQLLKEINGSGTPTVLAQKSVPRGSPSSNCSPTGSARASSVWIGRSAVSHEHRDQGKVEVVDFMVTPHQGQHTACSPPQLCLTPAGPDPSGSTVADANFSLFNVLDRTESPLIFCDIDSDISTTPSPTAPHTTELSAALTEAEKRARSPELSSHWLDKKLRTMSRPLVQSVDVEQHQRQSSSWRDNITNDDRSLIRTCTFTEREPTLPQHVGSAGDNQFPVLSSFRPEVANPQGLPICVTPARPSTRSSLVIDKEPTPEPDETPVYARTLHLIDTDVSIYKKVHGDEWRENSLCLYCFRRYGHFSKLTPHGYELCGRDEALESHYWESHRRDV